MTTHFKRNLLAATIAMTAFNASAAVELYNKDDMTFSTDGLVNVFYTNSSIETTDDAGMKSDRDQSRVRMGFLPNNIGFNFANQVDDIKIGVRSSFWVSISDTDNTRDPVPSDLGTGSLIDVRQFYATVSGDFGEILLGKDFGLFNRANILNDELLLGHGQTSDTLGLVDGGNVSFGNIATGYTYPFPKAQITYRSPDMSGFKLAVGIMDPNKSGVGSSEDAPRVEAELMYSAKMDDGSFKAWVSGVTQSSETAEGIDQDQSGFGYGANIKFAGFSLTASGFSSDGLGHVAGLDTFVGDDSIETDGHLVQASYTMGDNRFVLSHGSSDVNDTQESTNTGVAYFRTVRTGLIFVAEYNQTEIEYTGSRMGEENDVFAIGAVVTF